MGEKIGIERTAVLVNKLMGKTNKDRLAYLKTINQKELKLLSEICLNIIKGNLQIPKRAKIILERVKKTLYKLGSRVIKFDVKRKLWTGIKGLHILNVLLPLVQNEFLLSS